MTLPNYALPGLMPTTSPIHETPSVMHAGVAIFEVFRQPAADAFPLFLCRTWSASDRLGTEQIVTRADGYVPLVTEDGSAILINDDFYLVLNPETEVVDEDYPVADLRAAIERHGFVLECETGVQMAGDDRTDNLPVNDSLITPKVDGDERVFYFIGRVLPGTWKQQVTVFTGADFKELVASKVQVVSHSESALDV